MGAMVGSERPCRRAVARLFRGTRVVADTAVSATTSPCQPHPWGTRAHAVLKRSRTTPREGDGKKLACAGKTYDAAHTLPPPLSKPLNSQHYVVLNSGNLQRKALRTTPTRRQAPGLGMIDYAPRAQVAGTRVDAGFFDELAGASEPIRA